MCRIRDEDKMKKALLCVLAGACWVGSAFGAPIVEDRIALCQKRPDKFVWVEKTQECIPSNPCESGNSELRNQYCANFIVGPGGTDEQYKMMHERYIKQVLRTGIKSELPTIKMWEPGGTEPGYKVVSYSLLDGGFVAFSVFFFSSEISTNPHLLARDVCSTYGHEYVKTDEEHSVCKGVASDSECVDIANFASLILEEYVSGTYSRNGNTCAFAW